MRTGLIFIFLGAALAAWAGVLRKQTRDRRRREMEAEHFAEWERELSGSEEGSWWP